MPTAIAAPPGGVRSQLVQGDGLHGAGRALTVWIDDVNPDQIDTRIRHTAHLFQQRVSKTADIRLTAVGDHLTAVRIH
ncbi:hypothetical protein K8369_35280, partial [Streptomyces sp. PSKA30]|nr:hypothetical protein [Streptomyces sp. PSKA30]